MPGRSSHVTIQDTDGVSYTRRVTAATPYEAVAQGLVAIRAMNGSLEFPRASTSSRCQSLTFASSTTVEPGISRSGWKGRDVRHVM
jgi:hypothetical protein